MRTQINESLSKYTEEDEYGKFYSERLWKRGVGGKKEDVPSLHFPVYYNYKTKYILIDDEYKGQADYLKIIPYHTKGVLGRWTWSKEKMKKERHKLIVKQVAGEWKLYKKIYEYEEVKKIPKSIIEQDIARTELGSIEVKNLFDGKKLFEYPKPSTLIKHLLKFTTNLTESSDIILDFFAGSGTTAHAVMELNKEDGGNRKFILVQLPEPCNPESEAYKAGFKTIADICKERIRRAANKIKQELEEKQSNGELNFQDQPERKLDLGFKVFKLSESNFKQWIPFKTKDPDELKQIILEFKNNIKPHATTENILYELMLKNGMLLTEKIEKKQGYYIVGQKEIVFMLEKIDEDRINEIIKLNPKKVIVLDQLFKGNDQLKTNTYFQFRDAGIEFKSV